MASNILAKLTVLLSAQTAEFSKALQASQGQLTTFTNSISKMGAAVGVSFGAFAAVGVIKGAINIIADFEAQMDEVAAITGAVGKDFDDLRNSALALGSSTKFTSQQVAELQTEFGRLGFSTKEILAATKATIDLSIATKSDLATAAAVAGTTVRGFGLSADETGRVVDVMAEAFNKSNLDISNFAESMKFVAPVAKQAGLSLEQTSAMLGVLADNGITGSLAGTSLRKIISDLGGESGTTAEQIQKLADKGLTGADAMSEVGRTAYASLLILAENTKKTNELTTALDKATGAGERASTIMGDNLTGDISELDSAYEGLILTFAEGGNVLRDVVQAMTQVVNATAALIKGQGALGGFFKFFTDQLTGPIKLLGFFAAKISGASKQVDDHGEKLRQIESTVKAAFDSGNVEAYIKALDQNINKEAIIAAIRKRQAEDAAKLAAEILKQTAAMQPQLGLIEQIEAKLKILDEQKKKSFSVTEIGAFNVKIQELRDQLELLNITGKESAFLKNLNANQALGKTTDLNIPEPTTPANPFATQIDISETDIEVELSKLTELDAARAALDKNDEIRKQSQIARQDAINAKYQESVDAALQYGSAIGDALGSALSGQKSFLDAMRQLTADLIKIFLQRALAGIISSAATTGAPPPVALALAAAGMAGISALFSKIGASGGGVSAGGGSAGRATTNVGQHGPMRGSEPAIIQAEFTIHGNDLVAIANSENNKKNRLGG